MRKSVRKDDPGYDPCAIYYDVYINGKKLLNCFTADEEKGEAYIFETDGSGRLIDDGSKNPCEKRLRGIVKLYKYKGEINALGK